MTAAAAPRLPLGAKLGYGAGDFGFGLLFLTASQFLLFYYTDVLGLAPATAGWVFGAAVVWDAVLDPIMGTLANRTRSRWGRYRPYLLFAAAPLGFAWVVVFWPNGLTGGALVAATFAAHLLFRTIYTLAYMPYLSLGAAMTEDPAERGTLQAFRLVFQPAAGILAAFATVQLAGALGGGQEGWFRAAAVYGAAASALILLSFAAAREGAFAGGARERPTFAEILATLRGNRPFWLVCGAFLVSSVGFVFFNKLLPYWAKYGLGADNPGPFLGVLAVGITLTIPLWAWVGRRTSKRAAFLIGAGVSVAACAAMAFAPTIRGAWMPLVLLLGAGNGGVILSSWAMMPDTVEYGEARTGTRAEGAAFGVVSFVQKASLGLAAGVLGEALSAIGYRANAAQGADTLADMKALMLAVPALFYLGSAWVIRRYPLDAATHARVVEEARGRRA